MRDAPRPLPKQLPKVTDIARMIQRVVDRPDIRLGDSSIGRLVEELSDGTPSWLTGSNVWMPAMFGETLPVPSDYDIVFATQAAASRFVELATNELNRRVPASVGRYQTANTKFGSGRILHPDGKGVIDAWALGDNETIGEVLMSYPHRYQRAAYYLSRNPSPGCVFRIATDEAAIELKNEAVGSTLFGRIAGARKMSRSSYPG